MICPDLQLVQVNGKAIGYVDRVKFLGLYVDSALSFKYHIRLLKYTLAAIIPLMKRLQYYAPPGWRRIYFSYFHSHLSFMCSIWGNVCHSTLRELQILQNRALKLLFGLDYCTPSVTVYTKTDVLPISHTIKYYSLLLGFKIVNSLTRVRSSYQTFGMVHDHNTRHRGEIVLPNVNSTTYGRMGVYFSIALEFNGLPTSIKMSATVGEFRIKLLPYV